MSTKWSRTKHKGKEEKKKRAAAGEDVKLTIFKELKPIRKVSQQAIPQQT